VDAYSLAVVLLSAIAMAAVGGWLVFGHRDENKLSVAQSQVRDLKQQIKSAQNRIEATNQHLLTAAERLESSLNKLTERVASLEADLAATTGLSGQSEIAYFRKELQRLSRANAGIYDELSTVLKYINTTQRHGEGSAAARERITELKA
jgi:septal ring factor EnvC (AmiA/AmiB activator)